MAKIFGVLACDPKGTIGKGGQLPWHSQADLQHFQQTVGKQPLIMGYNTFIHLPRRYLKDRKVIVFTHHSLELPVITVSSLEAFFNLKREETFYLIGGGQIAKLFLDQGLVDEWIITEFKKEYEGDTFFPLERLKFWPHKKMHQTSEFSIYKYFKPCK